MKVECTQWPSYADWDRAYRYALLTVGKKPVRPPTEEWKRNLLASRHSPIRELRFSFVLEDIPYWVSVHLCRHVFAQPYVGSQREDRTGEPRDTKPQNTPVTMAWSMSAEELIQIANKRLCAQASPETQQVVAMICRTASEVCPAIKNELVPMCVRNGGKCYEFHPCGRWERERDEIQV